MNVRADASAQISGPLLVLLFVLFCFVSVMSLLSRIPQLLYPFICWTFRFASISSVLY